MVESEKNSDQIYSVDMQSGVCSCMKGVTKAPCKHKFACAKFFQVSQFYALPDQDIEMKQMYCKIAMGYSLPRSWYIELQDVGADDAGGDNNNDSGEDVDCEDGSNEYNENADDENPPDVTSGHEQVSNDDELNLDFNEMSLDDEDTPEAVLVEGVFCTL